MRSCKSPSFQKSLFSTISYKIFETNSSFHVKLRTTGKVYSRFFETFLLVLTTFFSWQEDWTLGYHSMKFRHRQTEIFHLKNIYIKWKNINEKCECFFTEQHFCSWSKITTVVTAITKHIITIVMIAINKLSCKKCCSFFTLME